MSLFSLNSENLPPFPSPAELRQAAREKQEREKQEQEEARRQVAFREEARARRNQGIEAKLTRLRSPAKPDAMPFATVAQLWGVLTPGAALHVAQTRGVEYRGPMDGSGFYHEGQACKVAEVLEAEAAVEPEPGDWLHVPTFFGKIAPNAAGFDRRRTLGVWRAFGVRTETRPGSLSMAELWVNAFDLVRLDQDYLGHIPPEVRASINARLGKLRAAEMKRRRESPRVVLAR